MKVITPKIVIVLHKKNGTSKRYQSASPRRISYYLRTAHYLTGILKVDYGNDVSNETERTAKPNLLKALKAFLDKDLYIRG